MPVTRFTDFPALSVDTRAGIAWSALETDVQLLFLPMTLKIVIHYPSFLFFLTFLTLSIRHSVFFAVVQK